MIDAGFSIICVAHSELLTIKKRNGLEYTRVRVNLGKQAERLFGGKPQDIEWAIDKDLPPEKNTLLLHEDKTIHLYAKHL